MIQVTVKGAARRFERPRALSELEAELALSGRKIAVEKNGEIVDGDRLEIVVAVGGG